MATDYKIDILRNGAFYKEASLDASAAPRIDFKSDADIKSSLSCTLLNIEDIKLGRDELQPQMRTDGGAWQSLGVFRITGCIEQGDEFGAKYVLDGYDRSWVLKNYKATTRPFFAKGAGYFEIIRGLLQECGFALIAEKPPINASIPAGALLTVDHEFDVGTTYLAIINSLLGEIGYLNIWFDGLGAAHLEPYQAPNSDNISFTYSAKNTKYSPIGADYTLEEDYYNEPNQFIVVRQSPETGTTWGKATNSNPKSKKSTVNRGMTIVQVIKVPEAYNSSACLELAKKYRDESMMSQQSISFYSLNEPGHGLNNVIAIDYEPLTGLYLETGWSLTMDNTSLMQHTARRTML